MIKCERPRYFNGSIVGCGKCVACRGRRVSDWKLRLLFDQKALKKPAGAGSFSFIYFVSLTYNDENLPLNSNLCNSDITKFIKKFRERLRYRLGNIVAKSLKYIVAGEYGTRGGRPHYHMILYGVEMTPEVLSFIDNCWQKGFVDKRPVKSMNGAVSYVLDYLLKTDGFYSLKSGESKSEFTIRTNRVPPFVHFSKGIGLKYFNDNLEKIREFGLKINGKRVALPVYFKKKLKDTESQDQCFIRIKSLFDYYSSLKLPKDVMQYLDSVDLQKLSEYLYLKKKFRSIFSKSSFSVFGCSPSKLTSVQHLQVLLHSFILEPSVVNSWITFCDRDDYVSYIDSINSWNRFSFLSYRLLKDEIEQSALNYLKRVELRMASRKAKKSFSRFSVNL